MIHDSHGTDADGQRCRDKGIGELVVSLAAGFALEPFAQVFDAGFQVYGLADERAKGKRDDEHGSAGGRQCFTVNDEHLLHGAAQSDKQNAQPRRFMSVSWMRGVIKRPPIRPSSPPAIKSATLMIVPKPGMSLPY